MIVKVAKRLLGVEKRKEARARAALGAVDIDSSARVNWHGVRPIGTQGCRLTIGANTLMEGDVFFDKDNARVSIGARSFIGGASRIVAAVSVTIGSDVLVSWGVSIVDHNSHAMRFSERSNDVMAWREGKKDWTNVKTAPVVIGDKAWIGFNAIILKGVIVGEGAIVGAGSVVTKDVAPWTVVAGNPAKLIRELPEDER